MAVTGEKVNIDGEQSGDSDEAAGIAMDALTYLRNRSMLPGNYFNPTAQAHNPEHSAPRGSVSSQEIKDAGQGPV